MKIDRINIGFKLNLSRMLKGWVFLLFVVFIIVASHAQADVAVGSNVALGKSYTYSVTPNYTLCSLDPQRTLLTDGLYSTSSQTRFWEQSNTVGWYSISQLNITFDLGSDQPISGFSFNAAAGTAGVSWPQGLAVLVSNDAQTWYYAGDVVALSDNTLPAATPYSIYQYKTTKLQTHGRYVQLIVTATPLIFIDEVEIYKGTSNQYNEVLPGNQVLASTAITDVQSFYKNNYLPEMRMHIRLNQDLKNVSQELVNANLAQSDYNSLNSTLLTISPQISSATISSPSTFTTVFPQNDLHAQIFKVQAGIWRAMGYSDGGQVKGVSYDVINGVVVASANRWDPVLPTSPPLSSNPSVANSPSVDVSMMSNEFRSGVLSLSNTKDVTATVKFSITGLPGGTNPSYIKVYQVPLTDTRDNVPVAAALMDISVDNNGLYTVSVPSGLTQQIWLTFNPTTVPAGSYSGSINLTVDSSSPNGTTAKNPTVNLTIYPLKFPTAPTLHVGGWDYAFSDTILQYGLTTQNRDLLISLVSHYFVDTPTATLSVMPTGAYYNDGSMKTAPSITGFNKWISLWPNARSYLVFLNLQTTFGGFNINTSAWTNAVTAWTNWWLNNLPSNIDVKLLIVDEPHMKSQDDIATAYASIIKQAYTNFFSNHPNGPHFYILEDPDWPDPSLADTSLFDDSDILSPNGQSWILNTQLSNPPNANIQNFDDFYLNQQSKGHDLWLYDAKGPARTLDPLSYYIAQEWRAWKIGAKAVSFWAFADAGEESGGNSWNEYSLTSRTSFTPLFITSTSVIPGKHIEAYREGVEDYEYMRMLRDEINYLSGLNLQDPAVATALSNANNLLTSAPTAILSNINSSNFATSWLWATVKDRTVQDQERILILNSLNELYQKDPCYFPPTVSLISPGNGSAYSAPDSIGLSASASAAIGATITKVEFYNGSTLLGSSTSSPYNYSWTNLAAGTYSVTAKAYDSNGAITTSSASNITVLIPYLLSVSVVSNNGFGEVFGTIVSSNQGIIECGVNASPVCSASVNSGTAVTLTAVPTSDSMFSGWSGACSGTGSCTVTMNNITNVTATFIPIYTITASAGSNGSISPTSATVAYGGSQVFTVTPSTGYTSHLTVDGSPVQLTNNTYTLTNVTATHTLAVTFSLTTYTLTASAGSNGSISPTSATVAYGGSQGFTVTPSTGYTAQLTVDGSLVQLTNNTYTLTNVTAIHTLSVNFSQITYTLNASAGSNGSISPTTATIAYGGSQVFTVTPSAGYTAQLTVDGSQVQLTNNTYVLTNVTAAHTLAASFSQITYALTASAGSNGGISPTSATVAYGGSQVFTVTPSAGYTALLTVDGSPVELTNNTYTLSNVTTTHTLAVTFSQNSYSITASAGSNGSITPTSVTVAYGGSQVFTVTPSAGYTAELTMDGSPVQLTNNSYILTNVTTTHTLAVTFSQTTFALTANAGSNGSISPTSTTVAYGGSQVFTVLPSSGYTPLLTVDGSPVELTNNTFTLTNVTTTHTLAVTFSQNSYSITASAGSNGSITPTSTTVAYGGSQIFTVTPSAGYTAELTVDGSPVQLTNNTYNLTNVTATHTLAVTFSQNGYSITASAGSNGTITPTSATVAYGGSQVFTVIPSTGYTALLNVDGSPVELTNNTYTFTNVTAAHTLAVAFYQSADTPSTSSGITTTQRNTFILTNSFTSTNSSVGMNLSNKNKSIKYLIEATAASNGSIAPTTATVEKGDSQIFTITPDVGYTAQLSVDGSAVEMTNNTYILTDVTAPHMLAVTFTQNSYILTTSAGNNGSIAPTSATVVYGERQKFTVTPDVGYTAQLTVDGSVVELINNTYTLTNVTAAHKLAVTFTQNKYTVTATSDSNGSITPATATVSPGDSQTFLVTPNVGYLAQVTVDDNPPETVVDNTYTLLNITAKHSIVVNFIPTNS